MNLFSSGFKNSYEELLSYYPNYYSEVYEMQEILKAEGSLADGLMTGIQRIFDDCFIDSAGEEIISVYERLMDITDDSGGIEKRRAVVKSYMAGLGKLSASLICGMISAYSNSSVTCDFSRRDKNGNYFLDIYIERGNNEFFNTRDINAMLSARLPAHIDYQFSIIYENEISVSHTYDSHGNILPDCGVYYSGQKPEGGA